MTSRGARLAVKGRDRAVERLGKLRDVVNRDLGDTCLDPVDLQVRRPEFLGELLPSQLPGFADLLDPLGNERNVVGHASDVSGIDIDCNDLAGTDVQTRVTVAVVERWTHDLTYEQCEAWLRDLGLVLDGKRLDWETFLRIAKIESTPAVLKGRWMKGKAPFDRLKARDTLEQLESKKGRTRTGEIVSALEQWNRAGVVLAKKPELLATELARVKLLVDSVLKREAAQQLLAEADATEASAFGSSTPAPKKPRK